jgi:hypothetical protein
MAPPSRGTDRWPTILWIAWRAGDVERQEPLCLAHRAYVFEHYPVSAQGLKRRGDRCTMCLRTRPRPRAGAQAGVYRRPGTTLPIPGFGEEGETFNPHGDPA